VAPFGVERAHMPLARIHPLNSTTDPDPNDCLGVFPLVRLEGFEPPTLGSVDRCSNPLSYSRVDAGPPS
jgi:hypothetical protein